MFEGRRKGRRGRRRKKENLVMEVEPERPSDRRERERAKRSQYSPPPLPVVETKPPPQVNLKEKSKSEPEEKTEPEPEEKIQLEQEEKSKLEKEEKSKLKQKGYKSKQPEQKDDNDRIWLSDESRSALTNSASYYTDNSEIDRAISQGISTMDTDLSAVDSRELSVLSPHHHPPSMSMKKQLTQDDDEEDSLYRDIEQVASSGTEGVFRDYDMTWAEAEYFRTKQKLAVLSIALSAAQLTVLMLQLALCGVAPLDVNPIVGPYPDAFSDWQGKNPYLMVKDMQLWRLITPCFLHVGVLHLLCNAAVQLETCAYFEREWGSVRWFIIYILSEAGCIIVSCIIDPDTVAVGSSGALVGLFGAKLAQVLSFASFDVDDEKDEYDNLNPTQMVGMLCMFALVAMMSVFSYIEWSGHLGGFVAGFFAGFALLCGPIKSACARVFLFTFGLGILGSGFFFATTWLFTEVEPDEELADSCTYFRTLFAEGYDCQCLWE